jgi:hypothetical protein
MYPPSMALCKLDIYLMLPLAVQKLTGHSTSPPNRLLIGYSHLAKGLLLDSDQHWQALSQQFLRISQFFSSTIPSMTLSF